MYGQNIVILVYVSRHFDYHCIILSIHEVTKRVLQPVGKIRIFQQNFLRLLFFCFQGYTCRISTDQYAIYYRINACNSK